MDLIYMGSRKRQDLLSKLGAWGLCEKVEGVGRGKEGSGEKYVAQLKKEIKKRNERQRGNQTRRTE